MATHEASASFRQQSVVRTVNRSVGAKFGPQPENAILPVGEVAVALIFPFPDHRWLVGPLNVFCLRRCRVIEREFAVTKNVFHDESVFWADGGQFDPIARVPRKFLAGLRFVCQAVIHFRSATFPFPYGGNHAPSAQS